MSKGGVLKGGVESRYSALYRNRDRAPSVATGTVGVVGIPGDTIAMLDNRLFINGEPLRHNEIDPNAVDNTEAGRRAGSLCSVENLDGVRHLVMLTPARPSLRSFGPVKIPGGRYFMMGDNRDNNADSRFFGFVERNLIVGRAVGVFISLRPDEHYLPRWRRFFKSLS
ncbi:MAG: signal peptidase I [Deltaproteobacteria bacterium]|nr:signal peptidase I [Deltaproteobacteria bacterium]